jgi:curved DNA-binding protein CbpA
MERGSLTESEQKELERLLRHAKDGDHYALLGVKDNAGTPDIQRAYYTLSRQWHPDRHFRRELGEHAESLDFIFIQITKAYKILNDSTQRLEYDRARRLSEPKKHYRALGRRERTRATAGADPTPSRSSSGPVSEESIKRQRQRRMKRKEGMSQLRDQVRGRVSRAKQYFEQGRKDYEEGKVSAAVSSLHLAVQFDPKNAEYQALYKQARREARTRQAEELLVTAENAESFQNYREAIAFYEKAAKLDPPGGLVFYRLGMLIRRVEQDPRRALQLIRTAVNKSPERMEFRLDLADLYTELGMALNARREYQHVLGEDRRNARARTGLRNLR